MQIQVATPKKVYLFDVLKGGDRLFFDRGLRYLLESTKIMKVMHDCRKDSEALFFQYGVTLRGVWDSQIAYTVLSQLKGILYILLFILFVIHIAHEPLFVTAFDTKNTHTPKYIIWLLNVCLFYIVFIVTLCESLFPLSANIFMSRPLMSPKNIISFIIIGYKTPYPIGLNTLLKACSCEENKFKDMVKSAMNAMPNFWEVIFPLPC